jgi:hypothetical protein
LASAPVPTPDTAAATNDAARRPFATSNSFAKSPSQASQAFANFAATDLPLIVSDADEHTWLSGARYAQMGGRRGGRRVGRRELSPLEEIHSILYDSARKTLQELDPRHPELQWYQPEGWIPRQEHVSRLNQEIARTIARIKGKGGLSELEPHHTLPTQFKPKHFDRLGIDIDHFLLYMPRDLHRLKPHGLHTGPEHWNELWNRFFDARSKPTKEKVLEQLLKMLKQHLD